MTIRIKIENLDGPALDGNPQRAVKVSYVDEQVAAGASATTEACTLKPGDAQEVYIHSGRQLKIEEV